ncbi:MAG TPA: sugar transferase [Candidatus Dormibacteraeota bacterium]|nr:sugar transferase [Candidatus Dormibacteraeota bacterium]
MLRRDRQIRMQIHQLLDACLFAVSFPLAYLFRSNPDVIDLLGLAPFTTPLESYVWVYLILIPAAPLILEAQGFYNRPLLGSRRTTAWQLFKACVFMGLGLILVLFFFRMAIARSVVAWFALFSFFLVFLKEELLRVGLKSAITKDSFRRRFLLIGTPAETAKMRLELKAKSQEAMEVFAEVELNNISLDKLVSMLHEHSVNGVIVNAKHSYFEQVEEVIRVCELEGVEAWLVAEFFKTQISRTSFDDFYGRPVLVFRTTPEASWQSVFKQMLDFAGALALLALFAIPMLVVSILIKATSPGPIFFRQKRSGLNGRPFTIYKFRTMVTNAEQLKHELESMNEMSGPVFKVTKDPRITPIGTYLRKFSIDEFPQLFNVLRGEMSLVGPRPLPVDEVKRFNDLAHRRRLSVKPGLTCLWQVSGRNKISDFRDWVRLDLEYIDNWSFWLDVKILWMTVPVVLAGTGAR